MGTVTEKPKDDGQEDDNAEARTVFVRNVPAEATQQLMREVNATLRHLPFKWAPWSMEWGPASGVARQNAEVARKQVG